MWHRVCVCVCVLWGLIIIAKEEVRISANRGFSKSNCMRVCVCVCLCVCVSVCVRCNHNCQGRSKSFYKPEVFKVRVCACVRPCACVCVRFNHNPCVWGLIIIAKKEVRISANRRFAKSKTLSKGPSSQNHFQNTKNIICLFHCIGTHWDSLTGIDLMVQKSW